MQIFNWNDVERDTGVSRNRIKYAIQRRRLGDFTMINGAYVFGDEDVARIENYFSGRRPWQRNNDIEINNQESEIQE